MTDAPQPVRLTALVYGSCVARDTVTLAEQRDGAQLVGYVARQSLVSVGRDATKHLPEQLSVSSPFQARMIRADFSGSLESVLEQQGTKAAVILWDLTDERHGLYRFPDGTVITRSVDNIVVPEIVQAVESAQFIPFGSTEHLELWRAGATALAGRLHSGNLFDRVVVLEVPWAEIASTGEATPSSIGLTATDANRLYVPYYNTLRTLGFRMITIPQSEAIADPDHRWGLAPFHYVPAVYAAVLDALEKIDFSTAGAADE